MAPEERFTKIENFLSTVAAHQAHMPEQQARMSGHQARHDTDVQELHEIQKGMGLAIAKVAEAQGRTEEAHRLTEEAHRRTEELQQITEQKLNALIETVDRIIGPQGDKS